MRQREQQPVSAIHVTGNIAGDEGAVQYTQDQCVVIHQSNCCLLGAMTTAASPAPEAKRERQEKDLVCTLSFA